MAYPNYTTVRSIAGAAEPTYLENVLASGYVNGQKISVDNTLTWYEVSSSGTATTNPLGTSGVFVLVVDYGQDNEEKILCASGAITIGNLVDIPIWTDGVRNGRGYDGTAISAHSVGIGTTLNVFPVRTAVDDLQFNNATAYIATLSGNQVADEANIASISGSLATLSGQYVITSGSLTTLSGQFSTLSGQFTTLSGSYYTTSGIVTNQTGYISTISGKQVTDENNIATLSGQMVTANSNIASTSGSLATLSGQFVTLSGKAVVSGTTANGDLSGTYPSPTVAAIQGKPISVAQATQLSQAGNVVVVGSGSLPRIFAPGEFTVITGNLSIISVGSLPTAPANGTINTIFNNSGTFTYVTISGGGTDKIAYGNGTTASGSSTFNVPLGTTTSLTYSSGVWYGNGSSVNSTGYGSAVYATSTTLNSPTLNSASMNAASISYSSFTGYVRQTVTNSATTLSSGTSASSSYVSGPYFTYTSNPTYSYPIVVGTTYDGISSGHSTTLYLQVNNGSTAYLPSNISVDGYQLSASGSTLSLPINGQASPTYTVTAASGNGTTITYTCANSLTTGNSVNVTGLPVTTGASLNIANMTVATATATQFTVTNTTVGTSVGSGTATPVRSFTTYYQGGTTWTSATPNAYETYTIQIVNTATNVSIVYLSKVAAGAGTPITGGGTGATTASGALANLGGLPLTGGTISGNLIVASGLTVSGTSTYIGNATFSGSVTVSGNSVLTSASTAGGDLSGTYPNPTLSGTANVQNIISNNSTVTGTAANLATLSGQYYTTSGIVTNQTSYIATLSGQMLTANTNISTLFTNVATLSGQYATTSGIVTNQTGYIATISGKQITDESNIASLSGSLATLSGQYVATSGIVTNQAGYISTISGKQITDESNIASLSGSLVTLSGSYYTTSGIVTNQTSYISTISGKQITDEANIASLSGSLATVSGNSVTLGNAQTISGNKTFTGTTTFSGLSYYTLTPSGIYELANKQYVDAAVAQLNVHIPAFAGTTGNLTATYSGGTIDQDGGYGIGATLTSTTNAGFAIDSIAASGFVSGSRILVKDQTTGTQNGIYVVTITGSASVPWKLTRASDYNDSISGSVTAGDFVFVQSGTVNANNGYVMDSAGTGPNGDILIGTDVIQFSQFSGAGQINAGTGMTKTGNTLDVNTASSSRIVVNTDNIDLATIGTSGTYGSVNNVSIITTDGYGRVSNITTSGIQIAENQVTNLTTDLSTLSSNLSTLSGQYLTTSGIVTNNTSNIATLSGQMVTANANIASTSGSLATLSGQFVSLSGAYATTSGNLNTTNSNLATLSGQYNTTSGIVTNQTSYIATLSGQMVTANSNIAATSGSLATLSGQFVTLSGSYNTTSGIVTTATGNISSLSGSLNTVSGVAYAALPISGGTITGNLTVNGTTTITGNNFNLYSSTVGGVAAVSGQAIVYSGGKWVPGTVATAGNSNALANTYYTNVSGAQGPINIYTATASGFLLFNYYAKVTATGTTSKLGPITLTSTDPDGNTIVNTGNSTSANSTVSGFINGVIPVLVASGSTVSYSMGYASSGTNMQYEVYTQLASSNLSVSSGVVSSFNGRTGAVLPSVGDYTSVISTDNRTSQSGSINSVTLATASGTGFFFFNHYAKITTSGSAGSILGPVSITTVDPDGTTVTNFGPFTSNNTITSGIINTVIPVYVASGTNITYSLGYTSSGSTMKYESYGMLSSTQVAPAVSIGVTSFNGRTGAITPAIGDYTASQIGALPILGGTVSGNLVVASGLTVSGTATINNNLIVASGLTISGTVTALSGFVGSLTNASGLSLTTGVTGVLGVTNGGTGVTISTGTGAVVLGTNPVLTAPFETVSTSATALSGSTAAALNASTSSFYNYTANPTAQYTINMTNCPTTTGQSVTFAMLVNNGATAYLPLNFTVNGNQAGASSSALPVEGATNNGITTRYQGGTAWTAADASTLDSYTFVVICTGSSTWTVLASLTKF